MQHEWLENGAFKALEKGYLKKIIFEVWNCHPIDPKAKLIESYTFSVSCTDDNNQSSSLSFSATKRQDNAAAPTVVNASTSSTSKAVSRDEVHNAMQKMIQTMVMYTSSLAVLPSTRWLSMSLVYSETTPPNYEAPEFCPQDPNVLDSKFDSIMPLVVPMGQVKTGMHQVGLNFKCKPQDEDVDAYPSTQMVRHDNDEAAAEDGYDSDTTEVKWNKEKEQLLEQAQTIVKKAQEKGAPAQEALRSSALGKKLSPEMLADVFRTMKVVEEKVKPRAARVKRPYQQITSMNSVVGTPETTKRGRENLSDIAIRGPVPTAVIALPAPTPTDEDEDDDFEPMADPKKTKKRTYTRRR